MRSDQGFELLDGQARVTDDGAHRVRVDRRVARNGERRRAAFHHRVLPFMVHGEADFLERAHSNAPRDARQFRHLADRDFPDGDAIGRVDLSRQPFLNRVPDVVQRLGLGLALRMTARQRGTRDGVPFVAVDEDHLVGHGSREYRHTGITPRKLEQG